MLRGQGSGGRRGKRPEASADSGGRGGVDGAGAWRAVVVVRLTAAVGHRLIVGVSYHIIHSYG